MKYSRQRTDVAAPSKRSKTCDFRSCFKVSRGEEVFLETVDTGPVLEENRSPHPEDRHHLDEDLEEYLRRTIFFHSKF